MDYIRYNAVDVMCYVYFVLYLEKVELTCLVMSYDLDVTEIYKPSKNQYIFERICDVLKASKVETLNRLMVNYF